MRAIIDKPAKLFLVIFRYLMVIILYFLFLLIFQFLSAFAYGFIIPERLLQDYDFLRSVLRAIDVVFMIVLLLVFIIRLDKIQRNCFRLFSLLFIGIILFLLIFNYIIYPRIDLKNQNNRFFILQPFPFNFLNQPTWNNNKSNYIATYGDSNTFGWGDWGFETGFLYQNKPFNFTFILKDELHTGVLNMGKGGAGSLVSMVTTPLIDYHLIKEREKLESQKATLFFFYEGNDMTDNLQDLKQFYQNSGEKDLNYNNFSRWIEDIELKNYQAVNKFSAKFPALYFLSFTTAITFLYKWTYMPIIYPPPHVFRPNQNIISFNSGLKQLPVSLQAPSLQCSIEEIDKSLLFMEYCMRYYKEKTKDPNTYLVFIPSVMSCYQFVSNISVELPPKSIPFSYNEAGKISQKIFKPADLYERNNYVRAHIKAICKKLDYKYIDPTDSIRLQSSHQILHGPKDWRHLNKNGQILLGEIVSDALKNDNHFNN